MEAYSRIVYQLFFVVDLFYKCHVRVHVVQILYLDKTKCRVKTKENKK